MSADSHGWQQIHTDVSRSTWTPADPHGWQLIHMDAGGAVCKSQVTSGSPHNKTLLDVSGCSRICEAPCGWSERLGNTGPSKRMSCLKPKQPGCKQTNTMDTKYMLTTGWVQMSMKQGENRKPVQCALASSTGKLYKVRQPFQPMAGYLKSSY